MSCNLDQRCEETDACMALEGDACMRGDCPYGAWDQEE